jgi:hypothetical protein
MRDVAVGRQTLAAPTGNGVGLIDAAAGGLPATAWTGLSAAAARDLLPRLAATIQSPTLRHLTWRLLKNAGPAPAGDKAGAGPSFLNLRIATLLALGDDAGAAALAALAPADDPASLEMAVKALMLAGRTAEACGRLDGLPQGGGDRDTAEIRILCEYRSGDAIKANLGLDLLRNAKPRDTAFIHAAEVVSGLPPARGGLGPAKSLSLGAVLAIRAAKLHFPAGIERSAQPPVLTMLAASDALPPARRLVAAERAEAMGLIDSRTFQTALVAADREDKRATGREWPALDRAAAAATDPARRLDLIAKAVDLATAQGQGAAACRLMAPLVASVRPGSALAGRAAMAARVLLVAGRADAALPWIALAGSDRAATAKLWPLIRIWTPASADALAQGYAGWRAAGADPRQAALALGLLSALGQEVPDAAFAALPVQPEERHDPVMAELLMLEAGRHSLGGVITAALAGFRQPGLDRADPATLSRVVAGLKAVGLVDQARRLATEAAVAYGL